MSRVKARFTYSHRNKSMMMMDIACRHREDRTLLLNPYWFGDVTAIMGVRWVRRIVCDILDVRK